ncbi:MAG: DUF1616 domain-containing protein [Patescibacteria group bacterium]
MLIKSNLTKIIKVLCFLAIVLFVLSFLVALIFGFPIKQTLRVVFGSVYVLFVPGFIWSYVFFPKKSKVTVTEDDSHRSVTVTESQKEKPLDLIERITLSIALSMAMGPLLIFFLNKVGVKINFVNSFIELLVLIIAGFTMLFIQERKKFKLLK